VPVSPNQARYLVLPHWVMSGWSIKGEEKFVEVVFFHKVFNTFISVLEEAFISNCS
jgi:hypothetical protein